MKTDPNMCLNECPAMSLSVVLPYTYREEESPCEESKQKISGGTLKWRVNSQWNEVIFSD